MSRRAVLLAALTLSACAAITGLGDYEIVNSTTPDAGVDVIAPANDAAPGADADAASDACAPGTCVPEVFLTLPPDVFVRAVTVDGAYLYYADDTNKKVIRVKLADGSEPTEVLSVGVTQFAVRGDALFYTSGLHRVTAGIDVSFAPNSVAGCLAFDPNAAFVYVADHRANQILRMSFDGGAPSVVITSADGVETPWGVAVNGTDLFFTKSGAVLPGNLRRRPLAATGDASSLIANDQDNPNCISSDGSGRLYWPNNFSGELKRIDPNGQNEVTLATGQAAGAGRSFTQLGIDARFVYWSVQNRIYRMPLSP